MLLRRLTLRLVIGAVTLAAVAVVVFFGTWALPTDPIAANLGNQASPALIQADRKEFGLNRPVIEQFADWIDGLAHGNFGRSIPSGQPVSAEIGDRLRNTAVLAGATLLFLIPLSLLLGLTSALRRDRVVDHTIAVTTLVLIATPEFVVGTFLILALAVWLKVLPPLSLINANESIFSQLKLLVLPVATLLAVSVAQMTRMIRAVVIEVLDSEYVQVATLKGVPRRRLLIRHVLPNALPPTLQILAFTVGWLIGGVVIVETVFQYPGLGQAVTSAVLTADLPTVEAIVMIMTAVYIVATMLADFTVIALDPRLRRRRA